jgi:phosphatidate cytidylyltransferase
MTQPDPRSDRDPPNLRAAHRARHASVGPSSTWPATAPPAESAAPASAISSPAVSSPVGEPPAWPVPMADDVAGWPSPAPASNPDNPAAGGWPRSAGPEAPDDLTAGGWPRSASSEAPDNPAAAEPAPSRRRASRAGRNLPAAVGVAALLGAVVLASLLFWKPAFYAVIVVAVAVGTWEITRAVRASGPQVPYVPLLAGGPLMIGLAWYGGTAALPYGLLGTALAVLVWRLADGAADYQRDVVPALLIAVYVPFLGSFAALLLGPSDGHFRVLAMLVGVVLSDTGGYVAGVFLGRHRMAPSVSPGKSWEGFAGSVVASVGGGAILLYLLLGATWWKGAVFGLAMAAAATLGDLTESMLKRDLKIKDMSQLLPGHGGVMDRLDSVLLAVPTAYAALTLLTPPT